MTMVRSRIFMGVRYILARCSRYACADPIKRQQCASIGSHAGSCRMLDRSLRRRRNTCRWHSAKRPPCGAAALARRCARRQLAAAAFVQCCNGSTIPRLPWPSSSLAQSARALARLLCASASSGKNYPAICNACRASLPCTRCATPKAFQTKPRSGYRASIALAFASSSANCPATAGAWVVASGFHVHPPR